MDKEKLMKMINDMVAAGDVDGDVDAADDSVSAKKRGDKSV